MHFCYDVLRRFRPDERFGSGIVMAEVLLNRLSALSADRQVRGVMVQDQMQIESGRRLRIDLLEEPDEFLVSMARQAGTDLPVSRQVTVPSSRLRAANKVVVPWRL
jgi:hypothetical protein